MSGIKTRFNLFKRNSAMHGASSPRDMIADQLELLGIREQMYMTDLISAQTAYESDADSSDAALNRIKAFEAMLVKLSDQRRDYLEQLRKLGEPSGDDTGNVKPTIHVGLPENFRAYGADNTDNAANIENSADSIVKDVVGAR